MAGGFRFHKKLRKCNNCGYETTACYNSHKVWSVEENRQVYCGFMKVVR